RRRRRRPPAGRGHRQGAADAARAPGPGPGAGVRAGREGPRLGRRGHHHRDLGYQGPARLTKAGGMGLPCTPGSGWRRAGVLVVFFGWAAAVSAEEPAPASVEAWWSDLASDDAAKAYRAVLALEAVPDQAVPLLRERVRPAKAPEPATLD